MHKTVLCLLFIAQMKLIRPLIKIFFVILWFACWIAGAMYAPQNFAIFPGLVLVGSAFGSPIWGVVLFGSKKAKEDMWSSIGNHHPPGWE